MSDETPLDLDAIRAVAEAATPGPWLVKYDPCDCGGEYACGHGDLAYGVGPFDEISGLKDLTDDARFVEMARGAVPVLLAEVDRLRAELAGARGRHSASLERIEEVADGLAWCDEGSLTDLDRAIQDAKALAAGTPLSKAAAGPGDER